MRFPKMLLALAGAVAMTGCSSLVSLNPFVTDEGAVVDPALTGVWTDAKGEAMYIVRADGTGYSIAYMEKDAPLKFEAHMLKAGEAKLLDLVSTNEDSFTLQAHTIVRVWPEGSILRMAFLDSDWLKEQVKWQLAAQASGDRTVITAPGDAVRNFLLKYGADEKAYGKVEVLQRAQ